MDDTFRRLSSKIAHLMGTPKIFILALALIIIWATTGPLFHFSNTWQLFINTFTTITTFLMVFLIQNTQNRDARAMHLKLDELLKAIHGARDSMVNVEELSDQVMEDFQTEFRKLQNKYLDKDQNFRKPINQK